jgi:NAD(P)-dependent dehydrogenase (short-subunit alcohol dehydrogenase family)
MLVSKHLIPLMRRRGGVIVNNASISGLVGMPEAAAYTASKGGLIALTRSLAAEWGPHGIRVNCICPGPIDTPMNQPWLTDSDKAGYLLGNIPLGRVAAPREIAAAAYFLCSPDASFFNGAVIPVDGGWTAV